MKKDAGPSTSRELDMDLVERSFLDENFKGEFTNATNSIYEKENLLTNKPPEKISSVSLAMAEEISKATINVLNESIVTTEEELIMFHESDEEREFLGGMFYCFLTTVIICYFPNNCKKTSISFQILSSVLMIQRSIPIIIQKILKNLLMKIFR